MRKLRRFLGTLRSLGTATFLFWTLNGFLLGFALSFGFSAAFRMPLKIILSEELLSRDRATRVWTTEDFFRLLVEIIGMRVHHVSIEISAQSKGCITNRALISTVVLAVEMLSKKVSFNSLRQKTTWNRPHLTWRPKSFVAVWTVVFQVVHAHSNSRQYCREVAI
jgi:hypothetical protein